MEKSNLEIVGGGGGELANPLGATGDSSRVKGFTFITSLKQQQFVLRLHAHRRLRESEFTDGEQYMWEVLCYVHSDF